MTRQELAGPNVFVIDGFLPPEECDRLIAMSEQGGYSDAPITTAAGFVMNKDVRNNARWMTDDPALALQLWERARPFLPERIGEWTAVGLNERLRFYRYDPEQQFAPHYDGSFWRNNDEHSKLTFMVYLNDGCEGGETVFYLPRALLVRPERGKALVFVHRLLHEGAPVDTGRKYVLRSDVMYRRLSARQSTYCS